VFKGFSFLFKEKSLNAIKNSSATRIKKTAAGLA
jgi:hypothetical protein